MSDPLDERADAIEARLYEIADKYGVARDAMDSLHSELLTLEANRPQKMDADKDLPRLRAIAEGLRRELGRLRQVTSRGMYAVPVALEEAARRSSRNQTFGDLVQASEALATALEQATPKRSSGPARDSIREEMARTLIRFWTFHKGERRGPYFHEDYKDTHREPGNDFTEFSCDVLQTAFDLDRGRVRTLLQNVAWPSRSAQKTADGAEG